MKKLSTYLFLLLFSFQTSSWADDIRDFQIEGMSIGDSLLDYFSETEIKKNKPPYEYNDNKFSFFEIHNPSKFENYDGLQIGYKTNDKNYIIYGIAGGIFYEDNIDECFTKKNKIELEVSELFNNLEKEDLGRTKHPQDKSGKSTVEGIYLNFKSGSYIRISCYDWSKEFEKKNWLDALRVEIYTNEFDRWINVINK